MKVKLSLLGILLGIFLPVSAVFAADCDTNKTGINLQVPLGPIKSVPDLGCYLILVYQLSISIVGIIAVVVLMSGGILWITSGGNTTKVGKAKELISSAFFGMAILFSAYTLLLLINPQLTNIGVKVPVVVAPKDSSLKTFRCLYQDKQTSKSVCLTEVQITSKDHKNSPEYNNLLAACRNYNGLIEEIPCPKK